MLIKKKKKKVRTLIYVCTTSQLDKVRKAYGKWAIHLIKTLYIHIHHGKLVMVKTQIFSHRIGKHLFKKKKMVTLPKLRFKP